MGGVGGGALDEIGEAVGTVKNQCPADEASAENCSKTASRAITKRIQNN